MYFVLDWLYFEFTGAGIIKQMLSGSQISG